MLSNASMIEKQRDMLLKKSTATSVAMSRNIRPGTGYSYGQNTDIDFNKLKTIVNENSSAMYEPGSLNSTATGLAPLAKLNNVVKFNENNNNTNNVVKL